MNRLTLKQLELLDTASAYNTTQHKMICGKATLELIEYRKIEDGLGIDLITLFKAVKQGIWFRNIIDNKLRCSIPMLAELEISKKGLTLISMEMDILFYFKDYGKTWALTKEELL